ncbi:MAG TPA: LysE family translocator [Rhodoglobus sp.]|nr:LysE family translocator [Rhodoglobus sp.]
MTFAEALLGFAVVAALLTITPGLDSTLVLRSALTEGRGAAIATGAGINTGALVWGAAAGAGASALLLASEWAFTALKLVGAVYLAYLGIRMLVGSFRRTAHAESDPRPAGSLPAAFARGLLTNLLNPKVGVFYIALIPQFIPDGAGPLGMGLLLALVHVVETAIWFAALIAGAHAFRRWLSTDAVRRWIDRVTGGVLIGFGALLAVESRA